MISDLELGRIFVAPIKEALNKTFLLGLSSNQRIINVTPGFVVLGKNQKKYIISHSDLPQANAILMNSHFQPLSPFALYKTTDASVKLSVYQVINNTLEEFPLYPKELHEGMKVFSIGPHMMPDFSYFEKNHVMLGNFINLSLGAADGIISKLDGQYKGRAYIQHTVGMVGAINDFGPLFTIQAQKPYLIGLNQNFTYMDADDPTYIGISFACTLKTINDLIEEVS